MRLAIGVALCTSATGLAAQPSQEPLIVTRLPEQELKVVAMNDPEPDPAEQALQSFAQALNQAAAADRQTIDAQCRSSQPVPSAGSERTAWEANCRYRRR